MRVGWLLVLAACAGDDDATAKIAEPLACTPAPVDATGTCVDMQRSVTIPGCVTPPAPMTKGLVSACLVHGAEPTVYGLTSASASTFSLPADWKFVACPAVFGAADLYPDCPR